MPKTHGSGCEVLYEPYAFYRTHMSVASSAFSVQGTLLNIRRILRMRELSPLKIVTNCIVSTFRERTGGYRSIINMRDALGILGRALSHPISHKNNTNTQTTHKMPTNKFTSSYSSLSLKAATRTKRSKTTIMTEIKPSGMFLYLAAVPEALGLAPSKCFK